VGKQKKTEGLCKIEGGSARSEGGKGERGRKMAEEEGLGGAKGKNRGVRRRKTSREAKKTYLFEILSKAICQGGKKNKKTPRGGNKKKICK